ncbi:MAG: hypothetical protein JOZ38_05675 [Candidatus Eremiobacteraeota bacterium]|nr:hypothetical protein [Candidatus Eremiobacteraeota bacterium]
MQFLVIARRALERFTDAQFAELLEPEAERVRELYREGTIRTIWTRTDVPGACFVLECADLAHAQRIVASLPLAAREMLDLQIIGLRGYRGFEPRGAAGS